MRRFLIPAALACAIAGVSGCMSEEHRRGDGLTDGAGNAMAANSVMQMVDPWQDGVQDTNLLIPATQAAQPGSADSAASAKGAQSISN